MSTESGAKSLFTFDRKQVDMAKRTLNRRELRKQADQAEQLETPLSGTTTEGAPAKKAAAPRVKKPPRKKAPPRVRVRWGVFDGGMKQVAIFDYNQRAAAEEKLAALLAKNKGPHFLQLVKEPMPEPGEAAPEGGGG
jgi:hypothetical protein